jgi:hypothetical protein
VPTTALTGAWLKLTKRWIITNLARDKKALRGFFALVHLLAKPFENPSANECDKLKEIPLLASVLLC